MARLAAIPRIYPESHFASGNVLFGTIATTRYNVRMSISIKTTGLQQSMDKLRKELKKFRGDKHVTVGIHEAAGNVDSGEITMAQLGAVHEFGANINHPGGTSYGYASERDAVAGKVRFMRKGEGFMQLGVTEPHQINIPARPWLVPGVRSATLSILETIEAGGRKGADLDTLLEQVGVVAVGAVQEYMTDLKNPPNAQSTIAKKGSDNPLIDSGALRAAVTHAVTTTKPTEGIG